MLSNLIKDEIFRKRLSYREAAREIGIAHTTLVRAANGKQIDLSTAKKIALWLKVDLSTFLSVTQDTNTKVDIFNLLLQMNPELETLLYEILYRMAYEPLDNNDLLDILEYVLFKLSQK